MFYFRIPDQMTWAKKLEVTRASAVLSTFWCCRFVCRRTIVCESLIRATIVELLMAKSIFFDIHLELPNNCPYCYYQVFFFFFLWLRLGPYWGRKWGCSPRAEKDVSLLLPLLGSDQQLRRGYTQCNIYIIRSQFLRKLLSFHNWHATFRYYLHTICFENILFKNALD